MLALIQNQTMKIPHLIKSNLPVFLFLLFAVLTQMFLFNNYRVEDVDDPWSLSFAYNYIHHNYEYDKVYQNEKLGGVAFFGKIYSYIYSFFLDITGWTKLYAHIISTSLVYLSLYFWYLIFKEIGVDKKKIIIILLLMVVLEPYINMGNKTRSDALAYFFSTLCFLLFVKKRFAISGIIGMMGLETHPLGVSGFFYCFAYFLWQYRSFFSDKRSLIKALVLFFAGIAIGAGLYLALHLKNYSTVNSEIGFYTETGLTANYIYSYFFESKLHRHIAEFILFFTALIIYIWKKMYKNDGFTLIFLGVVIFQSLVLPRGNANYGVFAFPAFVLLAVHAASGIKKDQILLLLTFLLLFPQYAYLYKMNYRQESQTEYIEKVRKVLPENDIPIFGSPNEWFAYYDREFYSFKLLDVKPEIDECYVIVEDDFRKLPQHFPDRLEQVNLLEEFYHGDEKIQVYHLSSSSPES